MKKFFEKHDLIKISFIMILITALLSWVVKQGYFNAGELVSNDYTRIGIFDFFTYGLLGMYYFTVLVTFLFVLGGFYQFLSKLGAYQKLTDSIAKKINGKEILFSLIISFVFAALASMVNEYIILIAFMPFIITICTKAKMDKISTFVTTFGSLLVGMLGSTISAKIAGMNVQYFGAQFTDNLLEKIILFAVAFIIYSLFNICHMKKSVEKISETKKTKSVKKSSAKDVWIIVLGDIGLLLFAALASTNMGLLSLYYVLIFVMYIVIFIAGIYIFRKANKPVWSMFVPIYNILVITEIAGLKWYYVLLYFIPIVNIYALLKISIEIAKKFNESTVFGVGLGLLPFVYIPKLAFGDSKYNTKKTAKASKKEEVVVKEVKVDSEDLFANTVKGSEKSSLIPLIIVGVIAIIVSILAYIPWVSVFKLDWFTKALEWVKTTQLFGVPIFSFILGNVAEFGSWDIFGVQIVMLLSVIVLAICYKQGLNAIIESFAEGFKKISKVVVILLLTYVILEFAVMYPVIPTILDKVLGTKFNVFTTGLAGIITSLFTCEYQYAVNLVYTYFTSAYSSSISVVSFILQSLYGLVAFFGPASAMLFVGLSFMDIKYKDWMKYI